MTLAAGAYRCDCGPECDGRAATCCRDCCAGARALRAWAERDPLGYLEGEATRFARANPQATPDTFIVAMACRFLPTEEHAIRRGFANARGVSI